MKRGKTKQQERGYAVFVRVDDMWRRSSGVFNSGTELNDFVRQDDSLGRVPKGCIATVEGFRAALEVNEFPDCAFQELTRAGTIRHLS